MITHVAVSELAPRDYVTWWRVWGQDGKAAMERGECSEPSQYYGDLFMHMSTGGAIEPLKVGTWAYGKQDQLYVHDGHHRFAIAKILGWRTVPTIPAGEEYRNSPRWEPELVAA